MSELTLEQKLQLPFPPEDIEWRAQSSGIDKNANAWAMIMPFITNRAIQERLDEVFGVYGWDNQYREIKQADGKLSFLCGISIYFNLGKNDDFREVVTKWDGADETNFENFKGGLSNSMKRAGVQLGIGRYLYKLDTYFAELSDNRNGKKFSVSVKKERGANFGTRYYYNAPQLPAFALPENFKYNASKKKVEDEATGIVLDEHEKTIEEDLGGKTFTQQCAEIDTLDDLKRWYLEQLTLGLNENDKTAMTACKDNRKAEIVEKNKQKTGDNPIQQYTFEELKAMKLPDLHKVCKDFDLLGYSKKPKADVINLILKHINK